MRHLATSLLLLAASGCAAGVAEFRPTERAWGASRQGQEQAIYELNGPDGRAGEAKVWTGGIRKERGSVVADVAIELKNTGPIPLIIDVDSLRLSGVVAGDDVIDDVVPLKTAGNPEVAPRSVGGLRVLFELPGDLSPRDVTEFRLEWTVRIGADAYAQFTPFVRDPTAEGGYGYYDGYAFAPDYWGPGWGLGLGLGWGLGWGWPGYYPYWGVHGHPRHGQPVGRDQPGIAPVAPPRSTRPVVPRGTSGVPPSPTRVVPHMRPSSPAAPAPTVRGAAPASSAPPVVRPMPSSPPQSAPPAARPAPRSAPAPKAEAHAEHDGGGHTQRR
jgi:hypothetical protein